MLPAPGHHIIAETLGCHHITAKIPGCSTLTWVLCAKLGAGVCPVIGASKGSQGFGSILHQYCQCFALRQASSQDPRSLSWPWDMSPPQEAWPTPGLPPGHEPSPARTGRGDTLTASTTRSGMPAWPGLAGGAISRRSA